MCDALKKQYAEMGRAVAAKDVNRVLRLFSPSDTASEDGRAWWQEYFAAMHSLDLWSITLDTILVQGDTARVGYTEHNIRTVSDPGSTATGRREAIVHEVAWWVRTPTGWLHREYVRDRLPVRVADGITRSTRHADSLRVDSARSRIRMLAEQSHADRLSFGICR